MKRFFLILIAASLFLAAGAQSPTDSRAIWGIKAAVDVNIPGNFRGNGRSIEMFRSGLGGTLGGVCNIYLGRNFYLEPGVSLFYDTYSYKGMTLLDIDGLPMQDDPSLYKIGVRIPVVAGYEFHISDRLGMTVYTGPEFSHAFAGDVRVDDHQLIEGTEMKLFGRGGNQRRFDCAWKVGVGFPFSGWMVSIDASIGMTNLLKSGMTFRENRCTVGLTRYF